MLNYTVVPVCWLCLPLLPSNYQILLAPEVQDGVNCGESPPLLDPHPVLLSCLGLQPPAPDTLSAPPNPWPFFQTLL